MSKKAKSGVVVGDCLEVLRQLPDKQVQCVVTSPPYWGLRDYGTATWEGGDPDCDHISGVSYNNKKSDTFHGGQKEAIEYYKKVCKKCGAIRVDDQLGIEKTPEEYVAKMVNIFGEIRRVLRDDGTVWLNLGDTYVGTTGRTDEKFGKNIMERTSGRSRKTKIIGLKPKDLVGIPWRVAFALQADGWYLRQDCIWLKPNVMPSSVTDRCVTNHEYIFLLTKNKKYFFDHEAIKEESTQHPADWKDGKPKRKSYVRGEFGGKNTLPGKEPFRKIASKRNKRSVWTINTKPFKGAHFAVFPETLILPCIQAGSSEKGCCPKCGSPWKRIVEKKKIPRNELSPDDPRYRPNRYIENKYADELREGYECGMYSESETVGWEPTCDCETPQRKKYKNHKSYNGGASSFIGHKGNFKADGSPMSPETITVGWEPTCDCPVPYDPVPCLVLDPFSGAGTTWVVCKKLERMFWGIELNEEYAEMSRNRVLKVEEGIGYPVVQKLPDEAKFLLSISGIGQKTALAIWDHFEGNIYQIVIADQKKLIEVSGVGEKSATDIIFGLRGYKEE